MDNPAAARLMAANHRVLLQAWVVSTLAPLATCALGDHVAAVSIIEEAVNGALPQTTWRAAILRALRGHCTRDFDLNEMASAEAERLVTGAAELLGEAPPALDPKRGAALARAFLQHVQRDVLPVDSLERASGAQGRPSTIDLAWAGPGEDKLTEQLIGDLRTSNLPLRRILARLRVGAQRAAPRYRIRDDGGRGHADRVVSPDVLEGRAAAEGHGVPVDTDDVRLKFLASLTPKEAEVAPALAGEDVDGLAAALGIGPRAARKRVAKLRQKLERFKRLYVL